ncbi:hypothetical protein ACFSF0_04340 [Ottowia flava]|uniref:XRE family transcriptional regulator n=1 Tax=Ottowia flava TaxID=2675430 RepID=A0ABW4KPN0_9BURK
MVPLAVPISVWHNQTEIGMNMSHIEPITEYLQRRLRDAGAAKFDAIAAASGVRASFIRKFVYGSRDNPRVQTVQPLLDFFAAIDRGEIHLDSLPQPVEAA